MKTEQEIIEKFEKTKDIASKFYLNGLLFCLGREDLLIQTNTEKKVNQILEELKRR